MYSTTGGVHHNLVPTREIPCPKGKQQPLSAKTGRQTSIAASCSGKPDRELICTPSHSVTLSGQPGNDLSRSGRPLSTSTICFSRLSGVMHKPVNRLSSSGGAIENQPGHFPYEPCGKNSNRPRFPAGQGRVKTGRHFSRLGGIVRPVPTAFPDPAAPFSTGQHGTRCMRTTFP